MWGHEVTGVSGEERAGGTLLERYEPLCANVPRRKKRHSHHPTIARAMKWGAIMRRSCAEHSRPSCLVDRRSFGVRWGGNHGAMRICDDGRRRYASLREIGRAHV